MTTSRPPIPEAALAAAARHYPFLDDVSDDAVTDAYPHIVIAVLHWAAELIIPVEGEAWLTEQANRFEAELNLKVTD